MNWLLLAEGIGQDAKGAYTAIGISQNVVITPTLPAATRRAIVLHVGEVDGIRAGATFTFTVNVAGPSGDILVAQSGQGEYSGPNWPDIPASIDIPALFTIPLSEYGVYRVRATLKFGDEAKFQEEVNLYARES